MKKTTTIFFLFTIFLQNINVQAQNNIFQTIYHAINILGVGAPEKVYDVCSTTYHDIPTKQRTVLGMALFLTVFATGCYTFAKGSQYLLNSLKKVYSVVEKFENNKPFNTKTLPREAMTLALSYVATVFGLSAACSGGYFTLYSLLKTK